MHSAKGRESKICSSTPSARFRCWSRLERPQMREIGYRLGNYVHTPPLSQLQLNVHSYCWFGWFAPLLPHGSCWYKYAACRPWSCMEALNGVDLSSHSVFQRVCVCVCVCAIVHPTVVAVNKLITRSPPQGLKAHQLIKPAFWIKKLGTREELGRARRALWVECVGGGAGLGRVE